MDIHDLAKKTVSLITDVAHLILLLRPITEQERADLEELSHHLNKQDLKTAKKYTRQLRIQATAKKIPYSEAITPLRDHITLKTKDLKIENQIDTINTAIENSIQNIIINRFKKNAWNNLQKLFAPNIIGFDNVKKGAILQLFSKDQIHILLLGDPGTGKTDILRVTEAIAPINTFSLGSGTTNTGLTVTVKGKEISKGILSLADNGIALIDELNLMKKEDRAGLYNAMEKGFITYDKGGHHYKFNSRCSILASANPKKGKFSGTEKKQIEKQIPFDSALLSRFHLLYIIREADIKQFMEITDNVFTQKKQSSNNEDLAFLKKYVTRSKTLEIQFSEDYNDMIKQFVKEIKEKEKDMLIDITPRFIIGLKRLIEASARMELRTRIEKEDVWRAMEVYTLSMEGITF